MLAKAAGKADRIAAEGLVGLVAGKLEGAVTEVNSETDFVARNVQFQEMVTAITSISPAAGGDVAKLLAAAYPGIRHAVESKAAHRPSGTRLGRVHAVCLCAQ